MVSATQIREISLEELEHRFALQPAAQHDLFDKWQQAITEPTDIEQYQLKRLQQNYENLSKRKSFSEESVKMVVLSPLLDLADFYQAPFKLATEEPVEIVSVDEGVVVKGKIDALVIQNQFWALTIESKSTRYDVMTALPQALAYMLGAPDKSQPAYGLLVNGREFVFVKLLHQTNDSNPIYVRSFALSIERNELPQVLGILKYIRQIVLESR